MTTSIAFLGYNDVAKALISKIKNLDSYSKDIKVHCIHVRDSKAQKYLDISTVVEDRPGNFLQVLLDGTEYTDRFTPMGNDVEWLLDSNGHNLIIDCMSYNEDSKNLIFDLMKGDRHFYYFFLNKDLVKNHWKELLASAKKYGCRLSFSALLSGSPLRKEGVSLTQDNFEDYAENNVLYEQSEYSAEEIAEIIFQEILEERAVANERQAEWDALSDEEKLAKEKHGEEQEKARLAALEKEKDCVPCGSVDTFSWADLD